MIRFSKVHLRLTIKLTVQIYVLLLYVKLFKNEIDRKVPQKCYIIGEMSDCKGRNKIPKIEVGTECDFVCFIQCS